MLLAALSSGLLELICGSASLQAAPDALRPADVEVALTRVELSLREGRYREAQEEAARVLALDPSQRARYFLGVACSRLADWTCAASMLEPVAASPEASWYPRLPLELGMVYMAQGRATEARAQLQLASGVPGSAGDAQRYLAALDSGRTGAATPGTGAPASAAPGEALLAGAAKHPPKRAWQAYAALATGYDSNAASAAGSSFLDCSSRQLADQTLPRSCGAVVTERLGLGWHPARLLGGRVRSAYQFQHWWYPDRSLSLLDAQRHQVDVHLKANRVLELAYRFDALALANRYAPLYLRSQEARVRYRPFSRALAHLLPKGASRGGLEAAVEYRFGLDRYQDLAGVWALSGTGTCQADNAPGGATESQAGGSDAVASYCTAGYSGTRHRFAVEARWAASTWSVGGEGALELLGTDDPRLAGDLLRGRIWTEIGLPGSLRLTASGAVAHRTFPDPSRGWTILHLQPDLALMRPLGPTRLWLKYSLSWNRAATGLDGETNEYRRHLLLLEVDYVFP